MLWKFYVFYRLRFQKNLDFPSLTAPQGERSDRACTGIAEP